MKLHNTIIYLISGESPFTAEARSNRGNAEMREEEKKLEELFLLFSALPLFTPRLAVNR